MADPGKSTRSNLNEAVNHNLLYCSMLYSTPSIPRMNNTRRPSPWGITTGAPNKLGIQFLPLSDSERRREAFHVLAGLISLSPKVVFEMVESQLRILADLDEVAVRITHVATPFPAVVG
jgi:hypothetical protein